VKPYVTLTYSQNSAIEPFNEFSSKFHYFSLRFSLILYFLIRPRLRKVSSGFPTKILHVCLYFLHTLQCLVHIIHFDLITLMVFGEEYSYEALHQASFSSLLLNLCLCSKCTPQRHFIRRPQFTFFPYVERQKFKAHTKYQVNL
jgi:hypothetical protein